MYKNPESSKLVNILSVDKNLIINRGFNYQIGKISYNFKITDVSSRNLEVASYILYKDIENCKNRPVERELESYLDKKSFVSELVALKNDLFEEDDLFFNGDDSDLSDYFMGIMHLHIRGYFYIFSVKYFNSIVLKISHNFSLSDLDKASRPLEMEIRNFIKRTYFNEFSKNTDLQRKFDLILEREYEREKRRNKLAFKIREEEHNKAVKSLENEKFFGFDKPVDKTRYKIR